MGGKNSSNIFDDLRPTKVFTITERDEKAHKDIHALRYQREWLMKIKAIPSWSQNVKKWEALLLKCGTPTTLHVDMGDMDKCRHWKIALDALLRAIPKRHGETPILFVYVPLSREKVQICLQVLVLVVLETGYILDQLK